MAGQSRFSMYSNNSSPVAPRIVNSAAQQSSQVSTTTLLNAVHNIYTSGQSYRLDASTSLVVNTWITAAHTDKSGRTGGTVDGNLAARSWEHARRRAEDGCVVLGSLHESTPSVLIPFLESLPMTIPASIYTALNAIKPFIHAVTPTNCASPRQSGLGVRLTMSLTGHLTSASLALTQGGIDTSEGLLHVPARPGFRAFDVFYYLLSASSEAEREFLDLKQPSSYALLAKSGTFEPPSYIPTADDAAAADDFRAALKAIGIKGDAHRNLISILAGILKLGDTLDLNLESEALMDACADVSDFLGVEPDVLVEKCSMSERETLIGGLYEALVDWVIMKANQAIAGEFLSTRDSDSSNSGRGMATPTSDEDNGDTVSITILEIPDPALAKAVSMRGVFDDSQGINAEMKDDGVDVVTAGSSIIREMENAVAAVAPDLGIMTGPVGREREHEREKREIVLEKIGQEAEDDAFIRMILFPVQGEGISLGRTGRIDLPVVLGSSRVWYHLSLHPTDDLPGSLTSPISSWSPATVSRQLRAWRLPEWSHRRNKNLDFTSDFDHDEFVQRYAPLGCKDGRDGIESWIMERGWSNGEVVVGLERIWMRESAWWEAESMLDLKPIADDAPIFGNLIERPGLETGYSAVSNPFFSQSATQLHHSESRDILLPESRTPMAQSIVDGRSLARSRIVSQGGDYGLGHKGDDKRVQTYYNAEIGEFVSNMDPELADPKVITSQPTAKSRRVWVGFVWALTFWIPSFLLKWIGRMRRPDVRMAWREKLVLFLGIFLLNGIILFYIIEFGRLLCPNYDKAWNAKEVATHQGDDDFYVSVRGSVYDISKFWKISHGYGTDVTTQSTMEPFAGLNLDEYFQPPLITACPGLNIGESVALLANTTIDPSYGLHTSGYLQTDTTSPLSNTNWYWDTFAPKIKEYYKGDLVVAKSAIYSQGQEGLNNWVIMNGKIYDLTDYFYTLTIYPVTSYEFLDSTLTSLIKENPGTDITDAYNAAYKSANSTEKVTLANNMNCLNQVFYAGIPDFRDTARCQVNNYILLAFTIILCCVILVKFLSALQFGSKRRPAQQDKFVICQVPAYTEGEDSLRKALDSLTALQYDNKRKLICVICDGNIVGGGNDRPTPKIVLDILGVDPKLDPTPLAFHSVGVGSEQLNFAKVYSGLYEFEGNVVPYLVIVKVGKESEKSKPGNRGKRDSQILLMSFLNRVHHRAPMNPLELEMFHQINNIIGVDPELYEYCLMVDADTSVREDSLNRLVAKCANDNRIAGICGETSLENEEKSWWTMIQVYEYFISHHLAKAFESLFGSVTCLPGCFTMYRLRTADKGKPLLISDQIIREYSDCYVDTLHKKNLLALGEDRFLTTLMTKHFPHMSYKFIPDAYAQTAAPETWSVLLSQRRRWINSTIHNLAELVWIKDMCGFCCFSMRFVVFIDLFGTLILPATMGYIIYLIWSVVSGKGQFPLISICMLAATYGLQALIFLLKRQWQHIGWMIIYLLAFPVYSLILPVYSFWNQDNFSWGNTRIVLNEGKKQIVAIDDDGEYTADSIPLQRWDDYAAFNNLPGRRGNYGEKGLTDDPYQDAYEMDDMKSMYSSIRPASTVLTGFPRNNQAYAPPPQSPAPYAGVQHRYSSYSQHPHAEPLMSRHQSMMSFGDGRIGSPHQDNPAMSQAGFSSHRPSMVQLPQGTSSDNLLIAPSPGLSPSRLSQSTLGYAGGARTPFHHEPSALSRPASTFDFQRGNVGPDDGMVVQAIQEILRDIDLDNVTKKQVRALVEQRFQTELVGERRTFLDRMIDNELANM